MAALILSLVLGVFATQVRAQCESYGVDFQPGGTYFQNASSTAPFTFVEYFEGCDQDVADNILVDPNGNEYECSQTPLTPPDTNELSTCPIDKDQLFSGDWSIIIASNNGQGAPIAYQRDFSLIVGIPSTITYTPTVTIISTSTPSTVQSHQTTVTIATTVSQYVTAASITLQSTTTLTPPAQTTTVSSTRSIYTQYAFTAEPIITTSIHTETCSVPPSQTTPDKRASVFPTLLKIDLFGFTLALKDRAEPTPAPAGVRDLSKPSFRDAFIAERRQRLQEAAKLQRRGLDKATTTVTDTNPSDFVTSISVVTASSTRTVTSTTILTTTSTTYTTVTVLQGTTTASQATATAPTPTSTITINVVATSTSTITQSPLITIVIPTIPPGSAAACSSRGGKLV